MKLKIIFMFAVLQASSIINADQADDQPDVFSMEEQNLLAIVDSQMRVSCYNFFKTLHVNLSILYTETGITRMF